MANLNLKAGDNITLTKSGENLEISSNQSEIIVSPTEPTTGEEVWLEKGKNLLSNNITYGILIGTDGTSSSNGNWNLYNDYVKVGENEDLTFSASASTQWRLYEYDQNKQWLQRQEGTGSSQHFVTSNNTRYVRFGVFASASNPMAEFGSTATTYEAYIDKKIYTKNDNGVYEEFYDETSVKGNLLFVGKTNTNLTLLDNINNYKELEITHTNNAENMWNIAKIPVMQTTKTVLQRMNVSNTTEKQITQFFFKAVELSGTSLTVSQNRALFMESSLTDYSTISGTSSSDNSIYITKIVGYK